MRDPYFDTNEVQHLFDSSGFWIAYRIGRNIFDPAGNWVGWLPFEEKEVHDPKGIYLAHIYPGNRLYRNKKFLKREAIVRPERPGYTRRHTFPGMISRERLPIGCEDIRLSAHV